MNTKYVVTLFLLMFVLAPLASGFRIVANMKPTEMPDGSTAYTYVQRYDSQSHVLINEPNTFELNLREELSVLDTATFEKIFDNFYDGVFVFKLTRIEPISYRLKGGTYRCKDRCDTGPKAELILTLPDGRHNDPNFKAAIDKVSRDWMSFGPVRYAITNIEVADFYENYIGSDRYYLPDPPNPRVAVDFCIIFGYLNERRRTVIPSASMENCFESVDELLAFLATRYSEDIASSAGDVLVSEGPSREQCNIDFERESELLEVKARPKQDKWEEAVRMAKFNMFAEGEIAETRGPTLNLAGLAAEDTGNALFDSAYKFDLISFSPKILTPAGSIVEREGIPDADIKITEVNSGEEKHSRMDYHVSDSELQAQYSFGGKKQIILRLYQNPAEIEMPYFVDAQNNNCASGCPLYGVGVGHCKDAYVKFAMKVRLFENEERFSWFMKTKREVQRLVQGPNINIEVKDPGGNPLGMGSATEATISFNDPVTGELYSLTKDVLGGTVSFHAPISDLDEIPITLTITATGYEPYNETFVLDSEPYEKDIVVQLQSSGAGPQAGTEPEVTVSTKYVVFSYAAFKTLVENYVPYFTGEQLPAVGDDLTAYPEDSYIAVYNALRNNRIFKLVDPENGQEVPYLLDFSFTGSTQHDGKEIPLHVVIKFDNLYLNKTYQARFFLPVPSRLAGGIVDSHEDLKVVTVNWQFTESGLIEANWQTRDAQPGEW